MQGRKTVIRGLGALALVVLLAVLAGCPGPFGGEPTPAGASADWCSQLPSRTACNDHWMADLADLIGDRPLKNVIIPMSHDSAAYVNLPGLASPSWVACGYPCGYYNAQAVDIAKQLSLGVRALDLRANYSYNQADFLGIKGSANPDFYMSRDDAITDLRLRDVMSQIAEWVADPSHSHEVIWLRWKVTTACDEKFPKTSLGLATTFNCTGATDSPPGYSSRGAEICAQFDKYFGPYLVNALKYADLPNQALHTLWADSTRAHIISSGKFDGCPQAENTGWGITDGYYAWQCYADPYLFEPVRPGITASVKGALASKYDSGAEPADHVSGIAYGPAVSGFYILQVQSTTTADCLIPELGRNGEQERVLGQVRGWFDRGENNARENLNIIEANFVDQSRLVADAIAMNRKHSGYLWITGTDSSIKWRTRDAAASNDWKPVDGLGARISAGPDGQPWVVNASKAIYHRLPAGTWSLIPGAATDIGVGPEGSVWVVGEPGPSGANIFHLAGDGVTWDSVDGAAVRIAVGPAGQPWVVNKDNQVFRRKAAGAGGQADYVHGSWELLPGAAVDIGVGAEGSAWITGKDGSIRYWDGAKNTWTAIDGTGVSIAVGSDGRPFVVSAAGSVFRRMSDGTWLKLSSTASDIGISPAG